MLKLTLVALLAAFSSTAAIPLAEACKSKEQHEAEKEKKAPAKVASATFRVEGMHCSGCSDGVKAKLGAKAGILKVAVAGDHKKITVEYDPEKWTVSGLAKAITELGYQATAES